MNGLVGALIGATGFGAANIVIKKSLSTLSIPQTLMMSTLSGIVCLLLFAIFTGSFTGVAPFTLLLAAGLAIAEVSLYILLYKTFSISNVTIATALMGTFPMLSAVFTIFLLHEPLTLVKLGFISLLIVGAVITSINWDDVLKEGFKKRDLVKGLGWIIVTMVGHALYFPILGTFTADGSWQMKLLAIKCFSAVFLFIFFYLYKKQEVLPAKEKVPFTSLLGFLEITGWAGFSWATSITTGQTAILIAALNSSSLVTAVLAYFFLSEKLSKLQYVGILIIIAGLTGLSL